MEQGLQMLHTPIIIRPDHWKYIWVELVDLLLKFCGLLHGLNKVKHFSKINVAVLCLDNIRTES